MNRYHVNPQNGNPGKCSAQPGNCPYASEDNHFETLPEAEAAFARLVQEEQASENTWPTLAKDSDPFTHLTITDEERACLTVFSRASSTWDEVEDMARLEAIAETITSASSSDYLNSLTKAVLEEPYSLYGSWQNTIVNSVEKKLAGEPALATESVRALAERMAGDVERLKILAKNPSTPRELLNKMLEEKNSYLTEAVASNVNLDYYSIQKILQENPCSPGMASNPKLSHSQANALFENAAAAGNEQAMVALASNPRLPAVLLSRVAAYPIVGNLGLKAQANLAKNPNTPIEILNALAARAIPSQS